MNIFTVLKISMHVECPVYLFVQILTGGNKPHIYHWQTNGELKTKVPSTATTLYSLTINHLPGHEVKVWLFMTFHVLVVTVVG